ncbi:hypothetical protein CQ010_01410 [Arthrobacter sp. MYb211]|uniref:hypothetical protein n=1 Tax=unclassified Arthrobacter TaxID=235627 RepID=UPI000CFB913C|nr:MULTISPECIES: hypothetical protein [unclassified Arthrobacter]PRA13332.1 hypothetical protein CQ015_03665 [Arthrobacter sp. MYb221]PRC10529.1 hypothetical protein CQ010_01410 [Arthrobacter sp. MYb211]
MKLTSIWTMRGYSLRERFHNTGDWTVRFIAQHLPKRIRYWVFIQVGMRAMPREEIVHRARFVDLVERAEGGPR